MIADLGGAAALRFIDFFTANIGDPNTRAAYGMAIHGFFRRLDQRGVSELVAIRTRHVTADVEMLTRSYRPPTVKEHLAAIRMLFDWLITGQVIGQNPTAAVRGPKYVVKKGRTPVFDGDEAKKLLASIDTRHRARPARPGTDRSPGLQLRQDFCGAGHERRGLPRPGQTLVGPAAR